MRQLFINQPGTELVTSGTRCWYAIFYCMLEQNSHVNYFVKDDALANRVLVQACLTPYYWHSEMLLYFIKIVKKTPCFMHLLFPAVCDILVSVTALVSSSRRNGPVCEIQKANNCV